MIAVQKVSKIPQVYYGINNFHYIFPVFTISPEILKRPLKMSSTSHPFLWRLKENNYTKMTPHIFLELLQYWNMHIK